MPPSPSLRTSPGRERQKESTHKRGRSLEHGLSRNNSNNIINNNKSRDDDLALFSAMQDSEREKESFLLQSSDDFDESLNKLRYFSEMKPVNIPARGETSDLLNAEGDKNDYDWLLTPPDTPLFPSLDDEEEPPQLKLVLTRGRSQSQLKSLSRSSTIERTTQRSSRSSASPSRHSPSPRSSISSTFTSSATPTAARRLSTPPSSSSQPATRRSASPAPRRISTPPSKRGVSPIKTSSPKWTPPAGFPSETPLNLKTASSARGRRQSMSPTASRSASSSHSHDRFSRASSGDDDVDSMSSVPTSFNSNSGGKKNVGMIKNRTVAVAKKPVKNVNVTVGSAPKRSFDSALWLMDHRKAPQNMFRPLLSSVPTTSFISAKSTNTITANNNRPIVSRNSSLTTSSNASSDHAVDQVDFDQHEEVFMFDKVEESGEEVLLEGSREVGCSRCEKRFWVRERDGDVDLCEECVEILNEERVRLVILARGNNGDGNDEDVCESNEGLRSDFGCKGINEDEMRGVLERNEEELIEMKGINEESSELVESLDMGISNDLSETAMVTQIDALKDNFEKLPKDQETLHLMVTNSSHSEQETEIKPQIEIQNQSSPNSNLENVHQKKEEITSNTQIPKVENTEGAGISVLLKSSSNKYPVIENKSVENTEGAGISVLLHQKSSSNKYPVVENKSLFSATNVQVSEPYYTRDHTVLKRSFGHQSSSASSSMDLGPFRNNNINNNNNMDVKLKRVLSNKVKTPSHKSTCSVSDMSISEASVKNNNDELYNSFDYENINDNKGVRIMSPSVRERNDNVREASIEERESLKSENMSEEINETMSEKINESTDFVDIKNQAEIRRVSVDEISSSPMESSIVELPNDNNNHEAPAGGQRREMRKSFTLEEATDTILFCSSIIHDLAYKAASISIDKKDDSSPDEAPAQPTVTIVKKAPVKEDTLPKPPAKRIVNARKVKRKRPDLEITAQETENIKESELGENNNNDNINNNDGDSKKPAQPPTPKLEAKCNCVIM
ncbi:hypothetical protein LUZ60_007772 [Juncus effusus]|nr:hypothetical protein LUZ60_007772 [Juncus effusus]